MQVVAPQMDDLDNFRLCEK